VVVASIDTYIKYSEAVGSVAPASKPAAMVAAVDGRAPDAVLAENAVLRAQLAATREPVRRGRRAPLKHV
jgi:hypothetical protein